MLRLLRKRYCLKWKAMVSEMPRYIDADALIKKIFPYDGVDTASYSVNAKAVQEAIKNAPTAEVAEVRHGKWVAETIYYKCSLCGENAYVDQFAYVDGLAEDYDAVTDFGWRYCPHCGAKMDAERSEQ